MKPSIQILPHELADLIGYRHPDCLALTAEMHSIRCYTVTVLDSDYRHYVWRANQNVLGGWSLAPVDVPEDTYGTPAGDRLDLGWAKAPQQARGTPPM